MLLSRLDPLSELTGEGSVVGSSDTEIRVSFAERLDLDGASWRCVRPLPSCARADGTPA